MAYDDNSVVDDNYVQDDDTTQGINLHRLPPPPPPDPATADSSMWPLFSRAMGKAYRETDADIRAAQDERAAIIPGLWGSLKQKLADYVNGSNAAPPHVVDAAMQAIADQNPSLDKSQVVQAAIAGPDPLSPDYMDQAGRDVFGGAGGSTTIGQAPARTGYNQTQTAPAALAQAVNPPLSRQDLIERGFDAGQADRIINAGDPNDPLTKGLARFLPDGFLNDPANRKELQGMLSTMQEQRQYARYVDNQGNTVEGPGGDTPYRTTGFSNPYVNATDRGHLESLAGQLVDAANARNTSAQPPQVPALQQQVSTGYNPTNMQQALRMRAAGTLPSDIQRQQDMRNLTYDPTGAQEAPEPHMPGPYNGPGVPRGRAPAAPGTPAAPRAPAARSRRSDAEDTGMAPVQTAMADSDTMSDASNDIRSTVPVGARVAAGYTNQPPAPGGFSGAAGPSTDVPVRQGAFTPAGAPVPAAPAAPADLPNGMKLVPTSGGQYDRAIVGSDGRVLQYIPKGQPSPSPQQAADIMTQSNTAEMENRLAHGDPTAIADLQARAAGQPGVDRSKPLPPAQAATAESMAATQAEQARRARGGFAAPAGGSGDPVQDLLQRAAQTSDPNAQRMFTNEAYKIQETRRINQQKSADAALKTFSTGEQTLIKSIYTKENAGNTLTPAEQALKDDYVNRIQQHSRSQSGGQQGATPGVRSTLQQAAGTAPQIPAAAIQDLKKNPGTRAYFDQAFGAGAAARYLGQ